LAQAIRSSLVSSFGGDFLRPMEPALCVFERYARN
jgi:hypothetical protein